MKSTTLKLNYGYFSQLECRSLGEALQ